MKKLSGVLKEAKSPEPQDPLTPVCKLMESGTMETAEGREIGDANLHSGVFKAVIVRHEWTSAPGIRGYR